MPQVEASGSGTLSEDDDLQWVLPRTAQRAPTIMKPLARLMASLRELGVSIEEARGGSMVTLDDEGRCIQSLYEIDKKIEDIVKRLEGVSNRYGIFLADTKLIDRQDRELQLSVQSDWASGVARLKKRISDISSSNKQLREENKSLQSDIILAHSERESLSRAAAWDKLLNEGRLITFSQVNKHRVEDLSQKNKRLEQRIMELEAVADTMRHRCVWCAHAHDNICGDLDRSTAPILVGHEQGDSGILPTSGVDDSPRSLADEIGNTTTDPETELHLRPHFPLFNSIPPSRSPSLRELAESDCVTTCSEVSTTEVVDSISRTQVTSVAPRTKHRNSQSGQLPESNGYSTETVKHWALLAGIFVVILWSQSVHPRKRSYPASVPHRYKESAPENLEDWFTIPT